MPTARVFQISVSVGGVPKLPVHTAEIAPNGVAGDRQNDRKHHGGPDRAVCVFSLERVLALQEEGYPLFPGAAGENLTLVGVPWDEVVPGARLQLGDEVSLEVVSYTSPCPKLKPWFVEGDFDRLSQETHPGWSRVYTRVLQPGMVTIGDPVILTKPDA